MIITDQPLQKSQPVSKRCRPVLAIHGGAGGTLPPNIPPELDRAYRDSLKRSLIKGYEVLNKGGSALDAVCRSVQEMEDDPLFNAAKGAVFTTAGTIECEASVMSALRPCAKSESNSRRCASAILVRRTKNPILLAKMLFENSRENSHVILSDSTAEEIGWKNGLDKVDSSYYHTRRRWLEHRRDLGLPDDEATVAIRRSVDSALDPPPLYTAHSTTGTPSLYDDDSSNGKERDTTSEANTPSNQSVMEDEVSMQDFLHWDINFDTPGNNNGGSDVASRGSGSFEQLPVPHNTSSSSISRHRSLRRSIESLPAGTVGAVALDKDGNLAVATSTGGITNKLPGRIGDTPIPGAGFFAEYWGDSPKETHTSSNLKQMNKEERVSEEKPKRTSKWSPCEWIRWIFCARSDLQQQQDEEDAIEQASNLKVSDAVSEKGASQLTQAHRGVAISGTGTGDYFLRTSFSSLLAHRMRFLGENLEMAGKRAVAEMGQVGGVGGAICIDEMGRVSFPMNSATMNRGYISDGGVPCVAIHANEECRPFTDD